MGKNWWEYGHYTYGINLKGCTFSSRVLVSIAKLRESSSHQWDSHVRSNLLWWASPNASDQHSLKYSEENKVKRSEWQPFKLVYRFLKFSALELKNQRVVFSVTWHNLILNKVQIAYYFKNVVNYKRSDVLQITSKVTRAFFKRLRKKKEKRLNHWITRQLMTHLKLWQKIQRFLKFPIIS